MFFYCILLRLYDPDDNTNAYVSYSFIKLIYSLSESISINIENIQKRKKKYYFKTNLNT